MWIQEWVDERFGVPNTVNIQAYEDFAKEVEGRILGAIDELSNDGEFFLTPQDIRQALKGESNE